MSSTISVITNENAEIIESGMLYKLLKKEHLSDFKNGRIYMNSLSYYTKVEEDAIGDKREGLAFFGSKGKILYKDEVVALCKNVNVYTNLNKPVFCTSIPYFNKNGNKYKCIISKFAIDEITKKEYEKYNLVIIDKEEFISRIKKALNNIGTSATCAKVIYTDKGYKLDSFEPAKNAGFVKRKKYEYQNEYRIMVDKEIEDNFILNIGNISDIIKVLEIDGTQDFEIYMSFP